MLSYKNCFLIVFFATTSIALNLTTASAQTWGAVFPDAPNTCTQWIGNTSGNNNPPPGNVPTTFGYCQCPPNYSKGYAIDTNCTIKSNGYDVGAGCWNPTTGICNWCGQGGTQLIGEEACFDAGQNSGPDIDNTVDSMWVFGVSCTQNSDCISGGTAGGYSTNSDRRLKRDIAPIAVTDSGIQLYSFKYLWSDQVYVGVMAQDLLKNPQWKDAVITKQNGFYAVIYSKLGLEMMTLEQYQQYNTVALAY